MHDDDFDTMGDDAEALEEAQLQARELLEEALDQVSEAAFVLGAARGLIDGEFDDDYEIDEDDLEATGDTTLVALSQVLEALYQALESLPSDDDEFGDDGLGDELDELDELDDDDELDEDD